MAGQYSLILLALINLALAAPPPALGARQDTTDTTSTAACSAAATISAEAACISGSGSAFVDSLCSDLTSTAFVYSTTAPHTITRTSTVSTSYSSTRIRTFASPTTVITTRTLTSTVRVTSGTTSSLAGSVTQTIVRTTTQYTCPNSAASTIFATPTTDETSGLKIRQATFTAPACFPYFSAQYGLEGIIQACRCLRPTSSIVTKTTTLSGSSTTGTTTVTKSVTATGRTTVSTTRIITRTSIVTASTELSTTVRATVPYISTVRSTTTTTLTSAYPLPTGRFRIFMTINGQKLYGRNVQAASNTTGTDVIALSSDTSNASSWGFNNLLNLILAGPHTKIAVEQNTWDVPFVYLLPRGLPLPDPWTAPTFAPCNDTLVPTGGESNNVFAACASGNDPNRRLAFGPSGIWNSNVNNIGDAADAVQNGTCVTGPLGIEAVSGSLTPTQSTDSSTTSSTTPSISDSISTTADTTTTTTSSSSSTTSSSSSTTSSSSSPTTTSTSSSSSSSSTTTTPTTNDTTTTTPTDTPTSTPTTTDDSLPTTGPLARAPIRY